MWYVFYYTINGVGMARVVGKGKNGRKQYMSMTGSIIRKHGAS